MNEPARNKFDRHPEPLKRICGGGGEFSARASPAGPLGNLAAGRCRSAKKKTAIAAEKCGFHESLRNQGSQSDDVSRSDPAVIGLNPFEIREAGQTWTGRRHTLRRSLNPFEIREAGQTRRRAGRAGAALGLNPFEIREAGQTLFNSGMGKSRVSQSLRNQGSRSD